MNGSETVESYLIRLEVPHEQINAHTWVVEVDNQRSSQIALHIREPILEFSSPVLDVSGYIDDREGLFQRLLELNAELMHSSYGLSEGRVVLSGAQELQNLDLNEFQAVLDDMTMALDTHLATLSAWGVGQVKA